MGSVGKAADLLQKLSVVDGSGIRWTPVAMDAHFLMVAPGHAPTWISQDSFTKLAQQRLPPRVPTQPSSNPQTPKGEPLK